MIAELYTVYRTELLRYCCMICGNNSDAEVLLQEYKKSFKTGQQGRNERYSRCRRALRESV